LDQYPFDDSTDDETEPISQGGDPARDIYGNHFAKTFLVANTRYDGRQIIDLLNATSVFHAFTQTPPEITAQPMAVEQFMTRYSAHSFMGILIDIGAASKSTTGAS